MDTTISDILFIQAKDETSSFIPKRSVGYSGTGYIGFVTSTSRFLPSHTIRMLRWQSANDFGDFCLFYLQL